MYFSALKTAVQHLEEKRFYDVALMYLEQRGYEDLSIVDGTGDGGRDVVCSRPDLRIQLSVRKDWEIKLNEEAGITAKSGKHHIIFVTNRPISPAAKELFFSSKYKYSGEVEVTLSDLRSISTALSRPGVIRRSYELLGMAVPSELHAEPKEIALSTVLLFSDESRELREAVIEANVRAQLLRSGGMSQERLINALVDTLPGTNIARWTGSALTRLQMAGRIIGNREALRLSIEEAAVMNAAENEFLASEKIDTDMLGEKFNIDSEKAKNLLRLATEVLIRGKELDGEGVAEISLLNYISELGLSRRKSSVFEALAKTSTSKLRQYGSTIDQIFLTNTFDIYRALGRRTELFAVLDTSVAMPVVFGLAFRHANSRFGLAAAALKRACDAHNIKMVVPRGYLNEMASHGLKAREAAAVYNALPPEARLALKSGENAYISHYSHIAKQMSADGQSITINEFLGYFGIRQGCSRLSVENRIETVLDNFGIRVIPDVKPNDNMRDVIAQKRRYDADIVIEHDASLLTMLKDKSDQGFIFATWDYTLIKHVEEIARVYADTPARVIDFLSAASGQDIETEQSFELMTTLLHIEEKSVLSLAETIEKISSVEQAFRFDQFVQKARKRNSNWQLETDEVKQFLDKDEENLDKDEENAGDSAGPPA